MDDRDYHSDSDWEEDCCICISRNFVFSCNVALLVFGLAAMGYSIFLWLTPDLEWAGDDLALRFTIFAAFLIIIGLIGITGTWDEVERCDLIVYLILIIGIIIGQIAFVIYFFTNEGSVKALQDIWDDWSDSRKEELMKSYDCGLYHDTSYNVTGDNGVIINQDPLNIANCAKADGNSDYCFEDCISEARDAIRTIGTLTSTFLIVFALLELMLLIATFILVCNPADWEYESEEEYVQPRHQPKPRVHPSRPRGPPREQRGYYDQRGHAGRAQNVQMTRGTAIY